jgi:2-C-methyl-D-erythritol 2,4-cyclodiphosphate synthase
MYLIGQGNDTHELSPIKDGIIILGGYKMKTNYHIISHSDGDIILHSLSNAILGALGLGDIGKYFKDTIKKTRGMDSKIILQFALEKMISLNYEIVNVDMTITCENIFFGLSKEKIKDSLVELLKTKSVNVKATRFERPSNLINCETIILIRRKNNDPNNK